MEEHRDLEITIAAFTTVLDEPELIGLDAGIVLQAYLPDSHAALDHLIEWATARRAAGGGTVKVRVVKGANLLMERVDAEIHGWPERRSRPRPRPTHRGSDWSNDSWIPTSPTAYASERPATTCSTSPSPSCEATSSAPLTDSTSRCCQAWRMVTPGPFGRRPGPCPACTPRSSRAPISRPRSPTWSVASTKGRSPTTSFRTCSSWLRAHLRSRTSAADSNPRCDGALSST